MIRRGFSMLEILIAAGLMGIMGALMVTSLSSSMDVKDAVETASDQYHLVRQGMSRMVREISMAYLRLTEMHWSLKPRHSFEESRTNFILLL